jgi:hypothetical protein
MRLQRLEKPRRDGGNIIDGSQERGFVGLGRLIKTADFPYELKRGSPNLVGCYRWIEVEVF